MEIAWHPDAQGELDADFDWYEARGAGLGDRFEAAVDEVVYTIRGWPESGAVWPGWGSIPVVRSRRVAGFPYRLVYLVQATELVVVPLAHEAQAWLLAGPAHRALRSLGMVCAPKLLCTYCAPYDHEDSSEFINECRVSAGRTGIAVNRRMAASRVNGFPWYY